MTRVGAQQPDMEHTKFQIGQVNYFGYGEMDLGPLRTQLPVHSGEPFTFATFDEDALKAAVAHLSGKSPTDIDMVCCDAAKHWLIFIGIAGSTYRPLVTAAAPTGTDHFSPAVASLYEEDMAAGMWAVKAGNAAEDDSQGYALAIDPAQRKIQLAMRAYARTHEPELIRVLGHSSDAKQRRIAAELLGYGIRSEMQVNALVGAAKDIDGETRNNAIRALYVLAAAKGASPLETNPEPFIALLYSGKWSDRNKGSLLLMRMTEENDAALLTALRREALKPLIEGASWTGDPGHSKPFLVILSRVLKLPPKTVQQMIDAGDIKGLQAAGDLTHSK